MIAAEIAKSKTGSI